MKLLDGSQLSIQVGTGSGSSSQLTIGGANISSLLSQVSSQNIGTQGGAQSAITALQQFSQQIGNFRSSKIGASQARLDTIEQNISSQRIGESEALSRIVDLDYASQVSFNTNKRIQASSGVALLAQSKNLNASLVGKLLSF